MEITIEILNKDFWTDTIVFTSKDDNLTKSHVRYVEAELIKCAAKNPSWHVPNKTQPIYDKKLPIADRTAMDEFVNQAKILAGTLGFDVFKFNSEVNSQLQTDRLAINLENPAFEIKGEGYQASGALSLSNGEFIVKSGSIGRKDAAPSLPAGSKKLREDLLRQGVLKSTENGLEFISDYPFSSPSSAASVVTGTAINGRTSWKTKDKVSYADYLVGLESNRTDEAV